MQTVGTSADSTGAIQRAFGARPVPRPASPVPVAPGQLAGLMRPAVPAEAAAAATPED